MHAFTPGHFIVIRAGEFLCHPQAGAVSGGAHDLVRLYLVGFVGGVCTGCAKVKVNFMMARFRERVFHVIHDDP